MLQVPKKSPKPDDVALGAAIRQRRALAGISLGKLGDAIGVTFQQVQKYENCTNRVGYSRLVQIAGALGCTVADLSSTTEFNPLGAEIDDDILTVVRTMQACPKERRSLIRRAVRTLAEG